MITALQKKQLEIENRNKNIGFTIRQVGIGDGVQFTSLPENFYRETGHKLIDVSKPWYLDHNPYVLRDVEPKKVIELWNYPKIYDWSPPRQTVYMTNAELHCSVLGIRPKLIRPRLYQFEDYPFRERTKILFQPYGISHGALPDYVIDHVLKKYKSYFDLFQIGLESEPSVGIRRLITPNLWDLVKELSEARMVIAVDSGPVWLAACYPDVIIKKIRTKFQFGYCEPKDWVPLDIKNPHSFWDCKTLFKIYNCFEEDCGMTESYRKI